MVRLRMLLSSKDGEESALEGTVYFLLFVNSIAVMNQMLNNQSPEGDRMCSCFKLYLSNFDFRIGLNKYIILSNASSVFDFK